VSAGQQRFPIVVDLDHRGLDPGQVGAQGADVELALHPRRPIVEAGCVRQWRPEDGGDGERRIGLGQGGHHLGFAILVHAGPQLPQYLAHDGAPVVSGNRGKRPGDDTS
jgi:hypothetical protein